MAEGNGGGVDRQVARGVVRVTAEPGGYLSSLNASDNPFRGSHVLSEAGQLVESGRFQDALTRTRDILENERGIRIEATEPFVGKGTEIRNISGRRQEVMRIPRNLKFTHPAYEVYILLHRNMSLILQRRALPEERRRELGLATDPPPTMRNDPESMRHLFSMDRAYARSLRRGVMERTDLDGEERDILLLIAENIDNSVDAGLESISNGELD